MNLVELIQRVGVDNVKFQPLAQAITNITTNKRGESTVSFATKLLTATEVATGTARHEAFVLWMPADVLAKVRKELGL